MEGNDIAHQVNTEIRGLAVRFNVPAAENDRITWLCVCGCFARITLTLAEYDALDGMVYARGHPVAG